MMQREPMPILRFIVVALLGALAYFVAGRIGILLTDYVSVVGLVWLASGVAVAIVLRYGPAGVLAAFLGSLATNFSLVSTYAAIGIASGAMIEALLVWLMMSRTGSRHFSFGSMPDVARLCLLALPMASMPSAVIGTGSLFYLNGLPSGELMPAALAWWLGDLTGAILLAPVLLSANARDWRVERQVFKLEWALVMVSTVLMLWMMFNLNTSNLAELGEFLLVPLVLWVALRFSVGAVASLLLFAAFARLMSTIGEYGQIGPQVPLIDLVALQVTLISLSIGGLLVVAALSERRESEQRLDRLANHDPLTGLANRSYFQAYLERTMSHSERNGSQVSLLFIDLDRFKNINDSRGHEVGDEVLRVVASRLNEAMRSDDFVARLGGDEFAVVMTHPKTLRAARRVAMKLIESLSQPFEIEGSRYTISASIGISVSPDDGVDVNSLLRQADMAMYEAKQKRSGFEYFSHDMNTIAHEQLQIENGLRQAILKEDFALLYQPKVDLKTGRLSGMEALIRWFGEEGKGIVGPDKFIPVAEETGLIVPIGHWALKTACKQWVEWQKAGLEPPPVAVNLSPRQFTHGGLASEILETIKQTGMNPNYLGLEITESTAVENPVVTMQVLAELGGSGIHMAIDDFGTGHSNLRLLKRLPIDTIKIDKSFVRDIMKDKEDAEISLAIIRLAHSLGLRVVAEGVETQEVAQFLRDRKCDEIQGYLIGKPLLPDAVKELFPRSFTFS